MSNKIFVLSRFFYSVLVSGSEKNVMRNTRINMGTMKDALFMKVTKSEDICTSNKVTIVGTGQVGMACAFAILTQKVSTDICLIDVFPDKVRGEMLDLQHGSLFVKNAKINASTDYAISAGSRICIITAGARQGPNDTRLDLLQRNANIMKAIVPQLVKYSPDTIILMVSNPVDILTYIAWKLSGLPRHRVIGSGTNLDSSRLRFLLSEKLGISASSVHGWIIGEHGDSSVPVWSGVNVAGVNFKEINPAIGTSADNENFSDLHKKVVDSAYEIIRLKGYTSYGIALSVSVLASSILTNAANVHAVSVPVKGLHGIEKDVFLSLPAALGEQGVTDIVKQILSPEEKQMLQKSAKLLAEALSELKL